ncbi:MFS transporter [Luteolibacter yonseiensis]|uniref:MFS transporter n=1 Tax=Luteolibacter yonseiensis TaxID=1144680 RepID=A0A934R116_9BACT|nr:MFS transporter [Luteolibacter yonseiensis]MBK1814517.1 MFS transporter [Luteolibacter yonseiensis]
MSDAPLENEPNRRQWIGFWSMIALQTQNAFNDKMAQFTLIPLGAAVGFHFLIPGAGLEVDVPSAAGLMMALPFVLFAPIAGWVSDRFSKRDVMLGAAVLQALVLAWICGAVFLRSMPLALFGFFALAVQSAFFSPAKMGINKELVGSKHLGFATGIQQMTSMLALLCGQIFAGWLFDHRFDGHGGGAEYAWQAALGPLLLLAVFAVPALAIMFAIPRVPAQHGPPFTRKLAISHFLNLADLWRDRALRRASFGVAFFWGFAAFINLWSVKLAKQMTGGGEGFGIQSSIFMAAASLGMAAGFGSASVLMRRRIELGWVPVAGALMTLAALSLALLTPGDMWFLAALGFLAFSAAVFLTPLNAWMQDRYPPDKRGELQSAVNLQDCFAGIIAVILIAVFEFAAKWFHLSDAVGFRLEIAFIGLTCGVMTLSVIRLLPGDFLRLVGCAVIRTLYRIRTVHPERIPAKGGALLLPNHVTFADAFFISAACTRPVRFVMDEAFTANPAVKLFTSIFHTVNIRREQPREAIRITIEALQNGDLVCLFPEGQLTRTGTLNELHRGFELIARKAGHPLIPLWMDGSWGSIFSFERGSFFRKLPYHLPYGLTVAFGKEMEPETADMATVRQALQTCSAKAISHRYSKPAWAKRVPVVKCGALKKFRPREGDERRRLWANGHQIGQVSALQRHEPFFVLKEDPTLAEFPALLLTFPELYQSEVKLRDYVDGTLHACWVGGDLLREMLGTTQLCKPVEFYDFGSQALVPVYRAEILHLPCLAVDGRVISMSMPDPVRPNAHSDPQVGRKPGTWGKLLPGWVLLPGPDGNLRAYGPAAPQEGLPLPDKAFLDAEGFLTAYKAPPRR